MKRTTGQHAMMAAIGDGFRPPTELPYTGEDQGDGTYVTLMRHQDGRTLTIRTRRGDGWQLGKLIDATPAGPWRLPVPTGRWVRPEHRWTVTQWWSVREMLAIHEPTREEPYCGGKPLPQKRHLDGRERDIITRILSEVLRACTNQQDQDTLKRLIRLDRAEAHRLVEIVAVLDPREE